MTPTGVQERANPSIVRAPSFYCQFKRRGPRVETTGTRRFPRRLRRPAGRSADRSICSMQGTGPSSCCPANHACPGCSSANLLRISVGGRAQPGRRKCASVSGSCRLGEATCSGVRVRSRSCPHEAPAPRAAFSRCAHAPQANLVRLRHGAILGAGWPALNIPGNSHLHFSRIPSFDDRWTSTFLPTTSFDSASTIQTAEWWGPSSPLTTYRAFDFGVKSTTPLIS